MAQSTSRRKRCTSHDDRGQTSESVKWVADTFPVGNQRAGHPDNVPDSFSLDTFLSPVVIVVHLSIFRIGFGEFVGNVATSTAVHMRKYGKDQV